AKKRATPDPQHIQDRKSLPDQVVAVRQADGQHYVQTPGGSGTEFRQSPTPERWRPSTRTIGKLESQGKPRPKSFRCSIPSVRGRMAKAVLCLSFPYVLNH